MVKNFILWLASGGYAGLCPFAPGTAGTVIGVLVYLLFSRFPPLLYLLSTVAVFFLALWAAERAELILRERDSPKIVIDEVVGYLITMALIPFSFRTIIGGFLFFRVLDIIKPPPISFINRRMKGGLAIVLDDAVAGLLANILLQGMEQWGPIYFYNF